MSNESETYGDEPDYEFVTRGHDTDKQEADLRPDEHDGGSDKPERHDDHGGYERVTRGENSK